MERFGPSRMETFETYTKLIFGCVFLAHLFIVQPLKLFLHVPYNLWPIYVAAVVVGWLWARRSPKPVYCRCPTCNSRVAPARISGTQV